MNIGVCTDMRSPHATRYLSSSPPSMDYYAQPAFRETMSLTNLLDTNGQCRQLVHSPPSSSSSFFAVAKSSPTGYWGATSPPSQSWGKVIGAENDVKEAVTSSSQRLLSSSPLALPDWNSLSSDDDAIVDIIDSLFSDWTSTSPKNSCRSSPTSSSSTSSSPSSPLTSPNETMTLTSLQSSSSMIQPAPWDVQFPSFDVSSTQPTCYREPPSYEHALQASISGLSGVENSSVDMLPGKYFYQSFVSTCNL